MYKIKTFFKQTPYKKFIRNKLGVACLGFILIMIGIALFAYIIAPDKTENANWGDLSIKSKNPGFETLILKIPIPNSTEVKFSAYFFVDKYRVYKSSIHYYTIDKIIYTPYSENSDIIVEKEVLLSSFPNAKNIQEVVNQYITHQKFYLGTDKSGRDYLSRIIVGSRISLSIGFVAVFISLVVGLF